MTTLPTPPYGLEYHTLYEAPSLSALRPYVRSLHDTYLHQQNYGQFVLIYVDDSEQPDAGSYNGQFWMVDTYHVHPSGRTIDNKLKSLAEMDTVSSYALSRMRYDFCYDACFKVNAETAKLVDPLFKLDEVRFINRHYVDQYDENDVFTDIHLGYEVGYDWHRGDVGVCLVRKDAEMLPLLTAEHMLREAAENFIDTNPYLWKIHEFETFVFDHRGNPEILDLYEKYRDRIEQTVAAKNAYTQSINASVSGDHVLFTYDDENDTIHYLPQLD